MSNSSIFSPEWDGPCPLEITYFLSEGYARSLLWSDFDVAFITLVVPIIAVIGIVANGSFLFVIARVKSMRTITNFYLANLAVSDMLFLSSVTIQETLVLYLFSSGAAFNALAGGNSYCSFYAISRETFYVVSMFVITLVTTERFFAICYPLKHRMVQGKGRAVRLVIGTWLFGGVYGFFLALNYTQITPYCFEFPRTAEFANLPRMVGYCMTNIIPQHIAVYTVDVMGSLPFAISLSVTAYMYLKIYRALGRRPNQATPKDGDAPGHQASATTNADKTRRHVARMLLANTAVFFVCNLPGWMKVVLEVADTFDDQFNLSNTMVVRLWQVANVMALLNSTVNPMVYNATNPRYRWAFRKAFSLRGKHQQRRGAGHSSVSVRVTSATQVPAPASRPSTTTADATI